MFNLNDLKIIKSEVKNQNIKNKIDNNILINNNLIDDIKKLYSNNLLAILKEPLSQHYYIYILNDSSNNNFFEIMNKYHFYELELIKFDQEKDLVIYPDTIIIYRK